jgi:hypothetical protein
MDRIVARYASGGNYGDGSEEDMAGEGADPGTGTSRDNALDRGMEGFGIRLHVASPPCLSI